MGAPPSRGAWPAARRPHAARAIVWVLGAALASVAGAAPVCAQDAPEAGTAPKQFLRDVGSDYIHFFSVETGLWLGAGGGLAAAIHPADENIRDSTQGPDGPNTDLDGGSYYGGAIVQAPLALGWWLVAAAAGSDNGAAAGRDLVRAQISAVSWTYALKYPVDRTRPNGDPRSFPSGHASSTFATAVVLQEHYGWKIGVPAFAAATYTAASRITDNKHWTSDVVFGAFLGMASGRTVTIHWRQVRMAMAPWPVPGGGGVLVTVG